MTHEEINTPEQTVKSVSAAYDSVALINELNAKEVKTEEDIDTLKRNVDHLGIMLTKSWFSTALTAEQKTEIQALA